MAKLDLNDFQSAIDVEVPLVDDEFTNAIMTTEMSKKGEDVSLSLNSPAEVYKEYAELIKTGKELLATTKYIINTGEPDGESIAAVANVMTSIKDTLKEFSILHTSELRHQRAMELERLKHENKMKLLEKKRELDNPAIDVASQPSTLQYSQEEIIKMLNN